MDVIDARFARLIAHQAINIHNANQSINQSHTRYKEMQATHCHHWQRVGAAGIDKH
jgi:hypothetical protein